MITPILSSEIFDAGRNPPRQILTSDADGNPVVAKMSHMRSAKFVSLSGHVLSQPLVNGSSTRSLGQYGAEKNERLIAQGAVPYAVCPLRDERTRRWLPLEQRDDAPCAHSESNEERCCPHVEYIISARTKLHNLRELEIAARMSASTIGELDERTRQQKAGIAAFMAERRADELASDPAVAGDSSIAKSKSTSKR